jgi:hypothetical protein
LNKYKNIASSKLAVGEQVLHAVYGICAITATNGECYDIIPLNKLQNKVNLIVRHVKINDLDNLK